MIDFFHEKKSIVLWFNWKVMKYDNEMKCNSWFFWFLIEMIDFVDFFDDWNW